MAPPKQKNPTYPKFGFDSFSVNVTDPSTGKPRTYTDYRPKAGTGYDILTDDVLNSGNLKLLNKFRKTHRQELADPKNAPAKEYLDARIRTAKRLQAMERKAKIDAAMKKTPPKLEVDNTDGIVGFSNLKYPDYQTSSNGCWSITYSTLLRSRGINLPQEEVRQWRPDYPEDIAPEKKANPERKQLMNSDGGNAIFPNSDLMVKVLPNTAMNQLRIEPFSAEQLTVDQKPLDEKQIEIVKAEYMAQVKRNLQKTIMDAIKDHRSPVAVSWDGHFVTITGISPDGNTLRYEESLGVNEQAKRTRTMSMDELIKQGLEAHDHYGVHYDNGFGLELNWLSDLPVAEHGSEAEQPAPEGIGSEYVKVNEDGSVSVDVPKKAVGVSRSGSPVEGQLNGSAVEQLMNLDQTELSKKLGGVNVHGWGFGGGIMFGAKSTYYPDKVMRPGDPELMKEAFEGLDEELDGVSSGISYILTNKNTGENKQIFRDAEDAAKVLEDAAEGKIGDIDKTRDKFARLIDCLAEKTSKGKTNFEDYLYSMNDSSRRKFVEGLSIVNQLLGLGKDEKIEMLEDLHLEMEENYKQQRDLSAEDAKAKVEFDRQINLCWQTAKEFMTGTADKTGLREVMDDALARIVASYALYANKLNAGTRPPYPTEQEIQGMIPTIKQKQAFEEITTGSLGWKFKPEFGPTDFVKAYAKIERRIQAEKAETDRYAISEDRLAVVQVKAMEIADRLDATKTGSYEGMGIVSRFRNSDEFEKAKAAIRGFSQKQDPSAKDIQTAADTVKRYLEGKETVRRRGFGRERWNDCMSFLAQVMPRDKFEDYCKEINEKRNVQPGHVDYVSPESFYPAGSTVADVEKDTKERIERGDATYRDFARLFACDTMREDNDVVGEEAGCGTPDEKRQLCNLTEQMLGDPRFKGFIDNLTQEERLGMIRVEPEVMHIAWDTYKEANPVQKEDGITKDTKGVNETKKGDLLPKSVSSPQA